MNANAFITLAVIFLALAVILAAVAVVLYRRFDIPAVRDELTGRAAKREIESLRGTRAGQWDNMEAPAAARDDRHGRGKAAGKPGKASRAGGPTTGSDIEFRHGTTGSVVASGTGRTGSTGSRSGASTDAGATHPLPGTTPGARPTASMGAVGGGAHAASAPGQQSARSAQSAGKDGAKNGDQAVVEIPVAIASAAELADEGETSLMRFRKPSDNTSDDDESRTILVHAAKHAAPGDAAAQQHATNESKSNR